jgi:hypothetical protein
VRKPTQPVGDAVGVALARGAPPRPVGRVMPQAFSAAWIFWPSAELPPNPPPAPDGRENEGRDPDGKVPDGRVRDPLGNPPGRPLGNVIPAALRQAWTLALPNTPRLPADADVDGVADAEEVADVDAAFVPELLPEQAAKPAVPRVRARPSAPARRWRVMSFVLCS